MPELTNPALIPIDYGVVDPSEPAAMAFELLAALKKGETPSLAAVNQYETGLTSYFSGDIDDMGAAFGIPPAKRDQYRHVCRDYFLMLAWDEITGDNRKARAVALARKIRQFNSCSQTHKANWSKLRTAIWNASQYGKLPRERQLQRIYDRCHL